MIFKEAAMIKLEHSPLGGSAAYRFMNCAFSFLKQREEIENGQFENVETEYSKLGTAAHELCATAVAQGIEPYEFLGEAFGEYLAGWPDGINLDAALIYFNACMAVLSRRVEQGRMILEDTIHLPHIHPLLQGTIDFGYLCRVRGVDLIDYKNGEGVGVAAPNNRQLLYYAFILIMSDPHFASGPRDLPVRLTIVQPNFYGIFDEPDTWETTLGYVLDWGHDVLLPRMNALSATIEYFDEDANPGEWCQFCPVMLECPKLKASFVAYANAEEDFIEMLTNQELDDLYSQRENARRFMKALENTVYARVVTGGNIPSAKLVEKKTNRVWKPGADVVLKAAFGDKAYKPREILSPAGVEKLSSQGKALALEYGYKPEANGLTIAPLTDPRPEAKPKTNANVFAAHAASPEQAGF
jgi:hypothetical protein